jgi:hypothetical protein
VRQAASTAIAEESPQNPGRFTTQMEGARQQGRLREGLFDVVTDVVERIGGRRPTTVADFLTAHRRQLVAARHMP